MHDIKVGGSEIEGRTEKERVRYSVLQPCVGQRVWTSAYLCWKEILSDDKID